ncbi:hypothetical protein SPRG_07737 [Saprolegnia parasitica CBS 223.65]|uniref:LNR domain-containing protein n=1 Tax=Saprolegnia parasitica (strain CBS 223.65) TaxID=695850 RepID=A0A067C8C0_SAPPC|nr:hypothetical protein SPRG_07737 [Saprolegnia parasitica CBS 223.65]KDO27024.1 hypothetical protein SPRG_07737 [Saprolegnia parasitica CBS 223.65]|eukprot:XP_012202401.1 hypothetical protein SPRG_07737 [Saprolegnia parasitica CBS 223.65]
MALQSSWAWRGLLRLMHGISCLYFGFLSIIHLVANDGEVVALNGYAMLPSGIIFGTIALLHLYPLCSFRTARVDPIPTLPTSRCSFEYWAARWPVPDNIQVCLNHFVAISCETNLAYKMARYLAQTEVAYLYAITLGINCLCTSWLLLLKRAKSKLQLIGLIDCVMSTALTAGFPLVFFAVPIMQYRFFGNAYVRHSFDWLALNVPPSRLLVTSSGLDLAIKTILGVTNFFVLRRLRHPKRSTPRPLLRTRSWGRHRFFATLQLADALRAHSGSRRHLSVSSMPRLSSVSFGVAKVAWEASKDHFTLEQEHQNVVLAALVLGLLWGGAVLLVATLAVFHREPCPSHCEQAAAPWFTSDCRCIYARLHCVRDHVVDSRSIDSYFTLARLGPDLFLLHVQRCDIPHGLNATTTAQFLYLYGIWLEHTAMREWPVTALALPSSTMLVHLRHAPHLTSLPEMLSAPPPTLRFLYVGECPLSSISGAVFQKWTHLLSLRLPATGLTTLPPEIGALSIVSSLDLGYNALTALPIELDAIMPHLAELYLDQNALSVLPLSFRSTYPKLRLYLNRNPIPSWGSDGCAWDRLDMTNTLYCNTTTTSGLQGVCGNDCASVCSRGRVTDYFCDTACNSTACAFDGGDCLF